MRTTGHALQTPAGWAKSGPSASCGGRGGSRSSPGTGAAPATRSPRALVSGYHAVDWRKRRVLRRAIRAYLSLLRTKPRTFRFDVVEVETGGPVRHFENVELFSKYYRP